MNRAFGSITLVPLAIGAVALAAVAAAPAHAALSCHDFTRAYVLGDQDVLVQAVAIAQPWLDASQALLAAEKTAGEDENNPAAVRVWRLMLMGQLASDCEALPDDTVDGITATHLKTTQRQLAEIAARNPAPNSTPVESTLEKLKQQLAQNQPSTSRPNPNSGSQPNGGGNSLGNDTAALSTEQRGAIVGRVRECWTKDAGAMDIDKQRVMLKVTTDASGVVHMVEVAGDDVGRMGDPRFRAFAERVQRAVMDPRCVNLPLPNKLLGKINVVTFRFSP